MASPPPRRVSWALLVFVITALAVGGAASILVGAASAPAPSSGPTQIVYLPQWLITIFLIGFLAMVIGSMVLLRLSSNPTLSLNRTAVTVLSVVVAALVFLLVIHVLGLAGSVPPPQNNSTSHGGTGTGGNPPGGTGHNSTGPGTIVTWPGFPPWLPFVVVSVIVLLTVVVAVPALRDYLSDRRLEARTRAGPAAAEGVREALSEASANLGLGVDPREVILALYATLLARLRPLGMKLDASTPEEIRATHLERLGVRPGPARTLTRLFEEARYSVHPMGAAAGVQAREAVQNALEDLDRRDRPE